MSDKISIVVGSFLLGIVLLATSGCVVEPREGYYDHGHHRYYHERHWHDCGPNDDHWCR